MPARCCWVITPWHLCKRPEAALVVGGKGCGVVSPGRLSHVLFTGGETTFTTCSNSSTVLINFVQYVNFYSYISASSEQRV